MKLSRDEIIVKVHWLMVKDWWFRVWGDDKLMMKLVGKMTILVGWLMIDDGLGFMEMGNWHVR